MKCILVTTICLCLSLGVMGCVEEFAAGAATGAAAYGKMYENAQDRFIEAVNSLNEETAKINSGVAGIEGTILIKPETLEAIKGLKGREKDPITWIALASVLANAVWGGRTLEKRKKVND